MSRSLRLEGGSPQLRRGGPGRRSGRRSPRAAPAGAASLLPRPRAQGAGEGAATKWLWLPFGEAPSTRALQTRRQPRARRTASPDVAASSWRLGWRARLAGHPSKFPEGGAPGHRAAEARREEARGAADLRERPERGGAHHFIDPLAVSHGLVAFILIHHRPPLVHVSCLVVHNPDHQVHVLEPARRGGKRGGPQSHRPARQRGGYAPAAASRSAAQQLEHGSRALAPRFAKKAVRNQPPVAPGALLSSHTAEWSHIGRGAGNWPARLAPPRSLLLGPRQKQLVPPTKTFLGSAAQRSRNRHGGRPARGTGPLERPTMPRAGAQVGGGVRLKAFSLRTSACTASAALRARCGRGRRSRLRTP